MTVHDQVRVGGVSETCKYNDHSECRAPGCACTCHNPAPAVHLVTPGDSGPEKACPTCGTKRPFAETFCRLDGSRLASLLCGMCSSGMNPEDAFCFNCGAPKGAVGPPRPAPRLPTVPAMSATDVDYGNQVLRSLQEELNAEQSTGAVVQAEGQGGQRVVEQPAGSQGSFKLVSSPNPNKIRRPVSKGNQGTTSSGRPAIKLPIKPA